MKKIKITQISIFILAVLVVAGGIFLGIFFGNETDTTKKAEENMSIEPIEIPVPDETNATKITLKQDTSTVSGKGVVVEKNKVIINQAGTYVLSGKLSDGKIEVDADEKDTVILLLAGAEITNTNGKAIESIKAAHTSVQMKKGTTNFVQSGEENSSGTEETTDSQNSASGAAIYAQEEMSVAGEGDLTVMGYRNDGIKGKQSLCIAGGNLTIQSSHDGVQAESNLFLSGGNVTVKTGEGSAKGFKCGNGMVISGGGYEVDAYDDAFHSNNSISITGGELTAKSGDDGIHAEKTLDVTGGKVSVTQSNEGMEANQITIKEGEINIVSSDDGMNAFGGNAKGGRGMKRPGQNMPDEAGMEREKTTEETDMPNLIISGGSITVDSGGDGLDSNGNLTISGGTIIVNGPTNDGNGALDTGTESGGKCTISEGTILALGSSGMAETFEESSSQCSFLHNLPSRFQKGDKICILDSSGKEMFSHTAVKEGISVVFSSPDLQKGETYTIQAGEQKETVTMESNSQSNGKANGFGGGGGFGKHERRGL